MKNESAARFSVSLPEKLLRDLDEMVAEKNYDNRSQAIADMIRDQLIEHRAQNQKHKIVGTITLVYDHHKPQLQAILTDMQHDHGNLIISTLHVHLDHDHCLEVLAVQGAAAKVKRLADALIATKGVKHGRLTVTGAGQE